MGEIEIRRVEKRNGQSMRQDQRNADALKAQHEFARRSRIRLEELRAKYGNDFDSVALIRAVRDEE